jgi:uncharacterized protein (DUF736 family)
MATIGTFTQADDGAFNGSIKTLTLNVKSAQFRPVETPEKGAPEFRIYSGQTEIGAAWKKTSKGGRDFLNVKLDDPSFSATLWASLVETDDVHSLIWSRSRKADD